MKVVILAGGYGTRLSEETAVRPKPMVEIGGKPILWHIMKIYAAHGLTDFVIACGYKGDMIRDYFASFALHGSDVTFDLESGDTTFHVRRKEPWSVTLVETGENVQTGGRLKRLRKYLGDDDFCMTYGDAVGDIDITALIAFHKSRGRLATVTAVHPPPRFGALAITRGRAKQFTEKPDGDGGWISGGFFVLKPQALDGNKGDSTVWELDPVAKLAASGELSAYEHGGAWYPMDTLSDRHTLEELWASGSAPWKVW